MFFQSKKKNLWKRLWRSRVSTTMNSTSSSLRQQPYQQQNQTEQSGVYYQLPTTEEISAKDYYYHQQQQQQQQNYLRSCDSGRGEGSSLLSSTTSVLRNCCTNTTSTSNSDLSDQHQLRLFRALVDKLKDRQLDTLCQAIENSGIVPEAQTNNNNNINFHQESHHHHQSQKLMHTDCVLIPRGLILGEEPQVIACRIWRWPDLHNPNDIKRIPSCPNEKDPIYICCNPAHWSRLCNTEVPPPPYCLYAMEKLKAEENSITQQEVFGGFNRRQTGSLTTDGEDPSAATGWCQLAYWELAQRVGRLIPVEDASVNVFSEQTRGDGLCLTTLALQRNSVTPDSVLKARQKIGLGVTLSREVDGVWLYNRSSSPVFVHSPTLCDMDSRTLLVYRVPPGHCLRAFDPVKAATESYIWPSQIAGAQIGPVDKHSVRISFAKGWGPRYSRQEVTACPCWLEVLLSPYR